jgi:hypothetical protein
MLTDNTLFHFQDWLYLTHRVTMSDILPMDFENSLVLNALIIEFFDSVGIYIWTIPSLRIVNKWTYRVFCHDLSDYTPQAAYLYIDRKQATIKAIEKANKIYNLKQNSNGNK